MKPINAIALSGFFFTAIALYMLSFFPFIPAWAVFITWACFFHLDGGIDKNKAFVTTIRHVGLGALASWLSALVVLNNPFTSEWANPLWAPLVIAAVIASLMRLGAFIQFSITPAIIYGYASIWAFLSMPGSFTSENLLSLTFQNAVVALMFCIVLGACAAYVNAIMVTWLCQLNMTEKS